MKHLAFLLLAVPLAACGLREPLRPPPGETMPPAPAMASRPLTTDELLEPPPVARPGRVDELLRRSSEREDDRFDLPPGDVPVDSNRAGPEPQ
jgi:predicted small lipoprotein YifL